MLKPDFIEFCKSLVAYFERKPIPPDTLSQWYQDIKDLPSEPLPWIAGKIKAMESFPRNVPNAIKHYWHEWLEANPDRRVKGKELGCDGCWCGYLQASRFEASLGGWYNTAFRCAICKPKYPQSMTMATPEILLSQGWHKPLGYITAWRYADCLPDLPVVRKGNPVSQKSADGGLVGTIAAGKAL